MGIFPRQDYRPRRSADGVRNQATSEKHTFFGNAVEIWRFVQAVTICAQGLCGGIVREDEQNVRSLGSGETDASNKERDDSDEKFHVPERLGNSPKKASITCFPLFNVATRAKNQFEREVSYKQLELTRWG